MSRTTKKPKHLGPAAVMRLLQRICEDKAFSPAERLVLAYIVVRTQSGKAQESLTRDDLLQSTERRPRSVAYRSLQELLGIGPKTMRAALRRAEGWYLRRGSTRQGKVPNMGGTEFELIAPGTGGGASRQEAHDSVSPRTVQIAELQVQLKAAIRHEDYAQAALTRDLLAALGVKLTPKPGK